MKQNKHRGSSFDDFLASEGILEECELEAKRRMNYDHKGFCADCKEREWISFRDKKPEKYQTIIIYFPEFAGSKHFMAITMYVCDEIAEGATHWQPKPRPPKEKS